MRFDFAPTVRTENKEKKLAFTSLVNNQVSDVADSNVEINRPQNATFL